MKSILSKENVEKRINTCKKKINDLKAKKLSTYGHWDLGYYEGKLKILQELFKELNS